MAISVSHNVSRGSVSALPLRIDHDTTDGAYTVQAGHLHKKRGFAQLYQCIGKCVDCHRGAEHEHETDCRRDPRSSSSRGCPERCLPITTPEEG
jgi:hypothetical protein